jgi:protein ImuA
MTAVNPRLPHLAELKSRISRIERAGSSLRQNGAAPVISSGAPEIDAALPWGGLPACGLHEVFGDAAATGFAASLLGRLAALKSDAPVLWCQQGHDLYGHGLLPFGLDPRRLILVHGRTDTDILWAMEEGLATSGLAGVVGVLHKMPPIAGRRLQLAAEEHGAFGLLLRPLDPFAAPRPAAELAATSMALTRWRVAATPSEPLRDAGQVIGVGSPRWRLELQRCRLSAHMETLKQVGHTQAWTVEWCNETRDLALVAALRDGSAEPAVAWRAAS